MDLLTLILLLSAPTLLLLGMTETTSGAFNISEYPSYFPPSIVTPPSSSMQGDATVTTTSSSSNGGGYSPMTSANANDMGASSAIASIYDNNDDHYDGGNNYDDDGDDDNDYGVGGGHEDFGEGGFHDEPFATASAGTLPPSPPPTSVLALQHPLLCAHLLFVFCLTFSMFPCSFYNLPRHSGARFVGR